MAASFRRVAIVGTGLIGGSFALALRKYFQDSVVVGWDKAQVLRHAVERGAVHEAIPDLSRAVAGADLVYVALPVGHTIELLPEIARLAPPNALVTDASSTKRSVCAVAAESFHKGGAHFLGGHPMAAKEKADKQREPRVAGFVALIEKLGAEPVWLEAEAHDRAAAVVSHLPQLLSVALAGVVRD